MSALIGAGFAVLVLVVIGATVAFITEPDSRAFYLLPFIAPGMFLVFGTQKIMGNPVRVTNAQFWAGMQEWQERHPDKPATILHVGRRVIVIGRNSPEEPKP